MTGGGNLLAAALSNQEGIIVFAGLPYGTYTIKEIAAPEGYLLSKQILTVNVSVSGVTKAIPYELVNMADLQPPPRQPEPQLPQTDGFGDAATYFLLGMLLVPAGGALLLRRRLLHKNNR